MPFEYPDDAVTSDVTLHAWAPSLDALFADAVAAVTNVMVSDLDAIRPRLTRVAEVAAAQLDLLLLRLLEEIVFLKDSERLLLRPQRVEVAADGAPLRARAVLVGEAIDPRRHALAADVKAVTLYGLRVAHTGDLWHAHVTLDV